MQIAPAKEMRVRLTFQKSVLGTAPKNEDIYRDFIGSKAPDAQTLEEEIAALGAEIAAEKGMTVFLRDLENGETPCLKDYHIKGFFKDACSMLARLQKAQDAAADDGEEAEEQPEAEEKPKKKAKKAKAATTESGKLKAYKKIIDGLVFIEPEYIPLRFDGEPTVCQRPLRAQTAQGERVALAMSEQVPKGTTCEFTIQIFDASLEKAVIEWLDYGAFRGIGQWRNSGKGRFTYEILD